MYYLHDIKHWEDVVPFNKNVYQYFLSTSALDKTIFD